MNKTILKKKEINDKEKPTTTAPIKKKVQIVYSSSEEEEDEEENNSTSSDDENTDVSEAEAEEEDEDEVDDDVSMGSMGDDFEETKKEKEKETKRSKKDVITTLDASIFDDEIDDDEVLSDNDVDEVSDDDDEITELYSKPNITPEHYVESQHPECILHNMKEIQIMCNIVRNTDGNIIDPLHTTIPILTKYERARICGQRATQIDNGSYPLVSVPRGVINSIEIAKLELEQKVIPFIIQRPLPSGGCEYWRVSDLEVL